MKKVLSSVLLKAFFGYRGEDTTKVFSITSVYVLCCEVKFQFLNSHLFESCKKNVSCQINLTEKTKFDRKLSQHFRKS